MIRPPPTSPLFPYPTLFPSDCTASTAPSNTGTATATDDCSGVASTNHTDVVTAGKDAGNNTIKPTYKDTDNCGNFSTNEQTIHVTDTTGPSITCPADKTVDC